MPADPRWLQPRLARVAPSVIGVSPKTWQNIVSKARSAMVACGIVTKRQRQVSDLTADWWPLWECMRDFKDKSLLSPLPRFVFFLDRSGIAPPREDWIITDVPELRIVDDALWERVKERQGEIGASPRVRAIKDTRFWEKKRCKHLLTGLLRCGSCGGGFAAVGKDYLACAAARKLDTCQQKRSFKRHMLEGIALDLLKKRLMRPEAVAAFITSVAKEVNAGRSEESAARAQLTSEADKLRKRIDGLYDAIADGLRTTSLKQKVEDYEARLAELDARLSEPTPTPVRLHPQLSEIYRQKVETLSQTLADPEIRPAALERMRGLIEVVTLDETEGGIRITLDGAITALVGLAQPETEAFIAGCSVKVVAGVGFEPTTFRL